MKFRDLCLSAFASACLVMSTVGTVGAAVAPVGPDWALQAREGITTTAQVDELVYDGARAQVLRVRESGKANGKPSKRPVIQEMAVKPGEKGALTFKARFNVKGQAEPAVSVNLRGPGINATKVFKASEALGPAADGFVEFRWDLPKPNTPDQGNVQITKFTLTPMGNAKDLEDELTVEFIDMVFEDAEHVRPKRGLEIPEAKWVENGKVTYRDIPVAGWKVEKPEAESSIKIESTKVKLDGKELPALVLRYTKFKQKARPGGVVLPLKVNADVENVVTFKAKVQVPEGVKQLRDVEAPLTGWYSYQFNAFKDNFGVGFQDPDGLRWSSIGVPTTHFLQHLDKTQPEKDGYKTFLWDIKHQNPTGNKGFDREQVTEMVVFYDNRDLPEDGETVITIVHPQLITGMAYIDGDTARTEQFYKEMAQYKPDYSDSTHYLGAPEKGRLEKPLPLVKDGVAIGEIIGAVTPWHPETNGTRELYQWLFRIAEGAQVPVLDKPSDKDNTKIFIGTKHAKDLFPEDIEALKGTDGAAIRTKGNNIYLFGATGKGTLNAIYTFLEGNTDIIWPLSSDTFEAVYSTSPNLDIVWGDFLHRAPARNWGWMGKATGPDFFYQVRNRANYLGLRSEPSFKFWGLFMEEGGGHNLHSWIPFSLFKTHPEYWAQIDGKRQHPNGYKNQICLSNPDGRKIFMENLRKRIDRSPAASAANCFNIKIEDNWGVCECEECTRPIRLPDGTILSPDDIAFRSTQFFMFLNSVANYLHNNGLPKLQIGTYVYFYTVPVPKVPISQLIRPYFCDYVRKDLKQPIYTPMNALWWRIVNNWAQISDRVVMREYTGLTVFFRPLADVAARDIRALLDAGVKEFTSESLSEDLSTSPKGTMYGMDAAAMEYWVILRLYWDPSADVQQLRKYFIRRTYREAAEPIERFYGLLREIYYAEKRTSDFEENQELLRRAIKLGKEKELTGYLESAIAQVKHPTARLMVKTLKSEYDKQLALAKVPHKQ